MQVWLLKVKHVYDEEFDDCGIFTSEDNMNTGKKEFLKKKKEEGFKADEYRFTHSVFELNKLH